jgi:hypothetical protein
MVFPVFGSLGMLGHLIYGWMLFQNVGSETNLRLKIPFAATFISWLISLTGLLFFAMAFWLEKEK